METRINSIAGLLRTHRAIEGISAVLLPFRGAGEIDWNGFLSHVVRTSDAGLQPAVNMDTGYVNLLDHALRQEVLARTREVLGGRPFVAGAFVEDGPGSPFALSAYQRQIESIQKYGGVPVIFQSHGLCALSPDDTVAAYERLGSLAPRFIAFELGSMFAPFGKIYGIEVYEGLMRIPQCVGAKHSSLSRALEWQRLALRDRLRPDFRVYTGNDLAIDMVMYGSDYLLGLSTMAPDLFARRDLYWREGNPAFYELNDLLQYLGFFAFRSPVPAYKHTAAQFLKLRGWMASDETHPLNPRRPESDVAVLRSLWEQLQPFL